MLKHKTEVSSHVWDRSQIGLRCLEGLDEAVLLSVSEVNEVIFNRELIIRHNGATERAAIPLDQISPKTDVMQHTKKEKKNLNFMQGFFLLQHIIVKIRSKELVKLSNSWNHMPYNFNFFSKKKYSTEFTTFQTSKYHLEALEYVQYLILCLTLRPQAKGETFV